MSSLKVILNFDKYFKSKKSVKGQDILSFLYDMIKSSEADLEKKWIITWNHYFNHLKFFFRWLYNDQNKRNDRHEKIVYNL